jgi:hypothetical protein
VHKGFVLFDSATTVERRSMAVRPALASVSGTFRISAAPSNCRGARLGMAWFGSGFAFCTAVKSDCTAEDMLAYRIMGTRCKSGSSLSTMTFAFRKPTPVAALEHGCEICYKYGQRPKSRRPISVRMRFGQALYRFESKHDTHGAGT